jgi:hemoglobin
MANNMNNQTPQYGTDDTSFLAAGQYAGIEKLVNRFYENMEELPEAAKIRQMHPVDLTESREKLTRFLCGWLGGPKLFSEKYGPIRIPMAHAHLVINEPERDTWLKCMQMAVDEQPWADDFKIYLMEQLFIPAERIRSVGARLRAEAES